MIYQKGSNLFNVAIYIRLSREDGDKEESDSVGNQRKLLTEYVNKHDDFILYDVYIDCLLYTSPSPRDRTRSRMPSSA